MSHLVVDITSSHLHHLLFTPGSPPPPVSSSLHLVARASSTLETLVGDATLRMHDRSQLLPSRPCDRGYPAHLSVFLQCLSALLRDLPPASAAAVTDLTLLTPPFLPALHAGNLDALVRADLPRLLPGLSRYARAPRMAALSHLPPRDLPPRDLAGSPSAGNPPAGNPFATVVYLGAGHSSVSCLHAHSLLPLSHVRLTVTLSLLVALVGELVAYQAYDVSGDERLEPDKGEAGKGEPGKGEPGKGEPGKGEPGKETPPMPQPPAAGGGDGSESDGSSSSAESLSAKRSRLLAEREARLAAARARKQRQFIAVDHLGDLISALVFEPGAAGIAECGVHEAVRAAIGRCPEEARTCL
ncbi:hypothetical protein TeGR_g11301 [Tetraparma gracilis]|uniref:Uncharacterized protein n=1 Tax=Tetraparma gracilis TaxID=2962635 RepID=A0ABQ6MCN4_9STRA|nr:hypothetical protein TeGR_g11301 [Tetraparma gracilis]